MGALSKKQLAAGQRRSLKSMRAKLLDMAAAWDGLDEYNITILTEAADKLVDVHAGLLEIAEEAR